MGNEEANNKDNFGLNIELIGKNLTNFKNKISKAKSKYSI